MLYRRRAIENYEFEYWQNNNSSTFRQLRPIMKILLIVQISRIFNSNTILEYEAINYNFDRRSRANSYGRMSIWI